MNAIFDNTQTFLLNIFLVYICFTLYFKFIERNKNQLTNEAIITLASGISIIFCMSFPLTYFEEQTIDFSPVPLIVGALYGGRRVAVILVLTTLTYRFYLDMSNFHIALFIYFLFLILLCFIIPFFKNAVNIRKKVYLAVLASLFGVLSIMAMMILFLSEETVIEYIEFFIFTLFLQSIGSTFFVIFNEKARRDVTLENEIGKLEKLKTVSELAASISHEVRNPLTVTKGFLQLLKDPDLTDEKKIGYIDIAIDALDQAESTITDYLTFAKPSLENIKILDLHKELIYIENFIDPYAAMNNVQIEVRLEEDIYIAGEDQKLHQCLINVVKNGIESMPLGGKLLIELRRVVDNAMITVTDTGIGMDEEQLERLGSPFFTTKDIGTGLGTMVAYSIIKTMRGEVIVKSEIGKGTSFSILLPIAENSLSPTKDKRGKLFTPSL
ncbi:sensor histidine kinase [Domibacillus aminovorans]|uniref:histidine kinase n=1 Tax=Domibacillus aminovorans TaxID=29332 RepID=A0A177LAC2_9BACI|nr:sensor histidine kinase [Domibacillus aminovorans]OAH62553.1 hypothetical protein AWH49_09450 [Domibacillus aminovorans]